MVEPSMRRYQGLTLAISRRTLDAVQVVADNADAVRLLWRYKGSNRSG